MTYPSRFEVLHDTDTFITLSSKNNGRATGFREVEAGFGTLIYFLVVSVVQYLNVAYDCINIVICNFRQVARAT